MYELRGDHLWEASGRGILKCKSKQRPLGLPVAPSWGAPDILWGQMAGLCPSDANSGVLYSQPVREGVVMSVIVRFGAPL